MFSFLDRVVEENFERFRAHRNSTPEVVTPLLPAKPYDWEAVEREEADADSFAVTVWGLAPEPGARILGRIGTSGLNN